MTTSSSSCHDEAARRDEVLRGEGCSAEYVEVDVQPPAAGRRPGQTGTQLLPGPRGHQSRLTPARGDAGRTQPVVTVKRGPLVNALEQRRLAEGGELLPVARAEQRQPLGPRDRQELAQQAGCAQAGQPHGERQHAAVRPPVERRLKSDGVLVAVDEDQADLAQCVARAGERARASTAQSAP